MKYLMVLPVEFFRLSDGTVATESAFHNHLRLLLSSLSPEVSEITVAAPAMSKTNFHSRGHYLTQFNEQEERIRFVALEPAGVSRLRYWALHLLKSLKTIWLEVGNSQVVHAGPSHIYFPRDFIAILFAWIRSRPTVFVVDIDWRRSAWMNWKTERFSLKSYLLATLIYDPAFSIQVRFASRFCSLILLKSGSLTRKYGRKRDKVKNILDAAHSKNHVINNDKLHRKLRLITQTRDPLKLVYFGRLTGYKGIDRMIHVVDQLRAAQQHGITLDIIGIGEAEAALRAQVVQLELSNLVRFIEPIQFGPQLFDALIEYDLLLATPLEADTPRSALDSMASGVPILAYDTDYYRDLQLLSNAVATVRWLDDQGIVNEVIRLSHDRRTLASMVNAGVEFARANTQEIWLDTRAEWTRVNCLSPAMRKSLPR